MSGMPIFYLYTTLGCHLCNDAQEVIDDLHRQLLMHFKSDLEGEGSRIFLLEKIDIAFDDALVEEFGTRIPVLLCSDRKRQLEWPFDAQSLYDFMSLGTSN